MMWGAAGQCVCYIFITGLLSKANDPTLGSRYGAGATAFFFLYYVFFGICWQVRIAEFADSFKALIHVSGCSMVIPHRD